VNYNYREIEVFVQGKTYKTKESLLK